MTGPGPLAFIGPPCPGAAGELSARRDGGAGLVPDEPPQLLHAAAVSLRLAPSAE